MLVLVRDWRSLLAGEDVETDKKLREGVKIGRPLGSESFLRRIESLTGCDLSKGKPGRPEKKVR